MDDANPTDPKSEEAASDPSAEHPVFSIGSAVSRELGLGDDGIGRVTFERERPPESTAAWLHLVSGPSAPTVTRGVIELGARFLLAGHRVLIVDGGPRLHLHERFGREARWGVIECLNGEMPALGLVQDVGRPGLFLLAHGLPAPRADWSRVGRLLDEVRPHFGRVVLALDADAPARIGESLAGWHLEGWWSARGRSGRSASRLSDRLRIFFSDLTVEATPDVKLEAIGALDARLSALSAAVGRPQAAPLAEFGPASETQVSAEGCTLECDPQVRERLRFLLWMRHVQREGSPADPKLSSRTTAVESI